MSATSFPTEAARRLFLRTKAVKNHLKDQDGETCPFFAGEVLAVFQQMVVAQVDTDEAIEIICCYLDDGVKEEDKEDLETALRLIARFTLPEGKSLIAREAVDIATSPPGGSRWYDGRTKLDALRFVQDMIDGNGVTDDEARGLLIKLTG